MYYHPISRRYFLRGLGLSLALPYLPSLMRLTNAAGAAPLRFIQVMNAHGQFPDQFYPGDSGLTAVGSSGVLAKPLSSISGNVSQIIGAAFSPYKSKFSLVRGLSVMTTMTNHNSCVGSCASGEVTDTQNEDSPPIFPYSTDSVLSESAKIYSSAVGIQRHVNFSAGVERYDNFSWNKINGQIQHMSNTRDTGALLAKFAPLNGSPVQTPSNPSQLRNANIMQRVYGDYKAVRDSTKISSADRNQLESYMALIDQVQKGIKVTAPTCSSKPASESEVDVEAITRNQINILVAAMACGLTRVGAISLSVPYDPFHGYVHSDAYNLSGYGGKQAKLGQDVAYLLSQMDSITETGGTMLDNSLIYWGNEYGENTTSPATGDNAHSVQNMPVLVAGGAAGNITMGNYIDYRGMGGMPLNNLLVTFFNAMGLGSADYERDGVVGFGEYNAGVSSSYGFDKYLSTSERRKPLPFLYKGTPQG